MLSNDLQPCLGFASELYAAITGLDPEAVHSVDELVLLLEQCIAKVDFHILLCVF